MGSSSEISVLNRSIELDLIWPTYFLIKVLNLRKGSRKSRFYLGFIEHLFWNLTFWIGVIVKISFDLLTF